MTVKYEYVVYMPGLETPERVAEEDGVLSGDQAVAIVREAIHLGVAKNIEVARREKGSMNWHDIPEAS